MNDTSERLYVTRHRITTCHDCPACWQIEGSATMGRCADRGATVRVHLHQPPPPQCPLPMWPGQRKEDERG